jgi:hypothetical protein
MVLMPLRNFAGRRGIYCTSAKAADLTVLFFDWVTAILEIGKRTQVSK